MRTLAIAALLTAASCAPAPTVPRPVPVSAVAVEAQSAAGQAINRLRAEAGRGPVTRSVRLERAARGHARDMARNGFFSHAGSDGSTAGQRARRAGYDWCRVGENIAKGQPTVGAAIEAWLNSREHRRILLSRKYTQFGLARADGNVWVLVFGRRDC